MFLNTNFTLVSPGATRFNHVIQIYVCIKVCPGTAKRIFQLKALKYHFVCSYAFAVWKPIADRFQHSGYIGDANVIRMGRSRVISFIRSPSKNAIKGASCPSRTSSIENRFASLYKITINQETPNKFFSYP